MGVYLAVRHAIVGTSSTFSLVVQFVAESRFANCEFANLIFDLDELQFSWFQISNKFAVNIDEIQTKLSRLLLNCIVNIMNEFAYYLSTQFHSFVLNLCFEISNLLWKIKIYHNAELSPNFFTKPRFAHFFEVFRRIAQLGWSVVEMDIWVQFRSQISGCQFWPPEIWILIMILVKILTIWPRWKFHFEHEKCCFWPFHHNKTMRW